MIEVKLSGSKKTLMVLFSGKNFLEIKEVLKNHRFSYNEKYGGYSNVWTHPVSFTMGAINELKQIENFAIPTEVFDYASTREETEYFRIPLDNSLLKEPPKGDFQIRAIEKGITQNRYYYGLEMGLGKTYIIVNVMNHLWKHELIDSILIIVPFESVYNFSRELLRFNTFGLTEDDIYIADVNNREPFTSGKKVVITHYRSFLMLADDGYFQMTGKKFKSTKRKSCYDFPTLPIPEWGTRRAIILDEAHAIKNASSRQSIVINLHKQYFDFRYELSGTPDPNGLADWYNQMMFLDESIINKEYFSWLNTVASVGNRFSDYSINYYYKDKEAKFAEQIKPWVMREFTEGNIVLPELSIQNTYLRLNKEQEAIYHSLVKYVLSVLKEEDGVIVPKKVESKLPFIMQAVENPCLLKGKIDPEKSSILHKMVEKWKFEKHSKLPYLDALLDKYISEGKRVIIWSGHPLTIQQLGDYYAKYNPVMLHGELRLMNGESSAELRNRIIDEFKQNSNHKVAILSYLMASTAVNITEATRTIYFDRNFNSVYYQQSLKRNHRIGQTENVLVNPLVTEKTIEESLDLNLTNKSNSSKELFKKDSLSMEQWETYFNGKEVI